MANTLIKISSVTVGSGGTSAIDFTNIPQTYNDLVIFASIRSTRTIYNNSDAGLKFNDLTTNMSMRYLQGQGASAASASSSNISGVIPASVASANIFSATKFYICGYTTAYYKSVQIESTMDNNSTGSGSSYMQLCGGTWTSTAAITKITIYDSNSANFEQYSTATLYGIKSS